MGFFKGSIDSIGSSKGKTFDDFIDANSKEFIAKTIKHDFEWHTSYWEKAKGDPLWIINGNKPD